MFATLDALPGEKKLIIQSFYSSGYPYQYILDYVLDENLQPLGTSVSNESLRRWAKKHCWARSVPQISYCAAWLSERPYIQKKISELYKSGLTVSQIQTELAKIEKLPWTYYGTLKNICRTLRIRVRTRYEKS